MKLPNITSQGESFFHPWESAPEMYVVPNLPVMQLKFGASGGDEERDLK